MSYGLVCAILVGMGCKGGNIFGLRSPSDSNVADLVARGQKLLRDGKPDEALIAFEQAVKADSLNSDARFYHAKAVLQVSGVSIVNLLRDVTENFTKPGAQLPLYSRDPSISQVQDELNKTKLYRAAFAISNDLTPISQGLTHGSFDSVSVGLDLAVANTIYAILLLRDTNQDFEIKTPADLVFDFSIISEGGGGDFGYDISDLASVVGTDQAKAEAFNAIIALLAEEGGGSAKITGVGVGGNQSLIGTILENLTQAGLLDGESTINLAELRDGIQLFGIKVKHYYINTHVAGNAGEGDNDGDGTADEEDLNGIDDDGDDVIDEDSDLFRLTPIES